MTEKYALNVNADEFPGGGSIRLNWEYPLTFNPLTDELVIVRRERSFSETFDDGIEVLRTSDVDLIEHIDTNLRDNTFYYYTWAIYDGTDYWFTLKEQDYALSTKRWGFSDILYNKPDLAYHRRSDDTKDLAMFCDVWGQVVDNLKSQIYAFSYVRSGVQSNPETMPALVEMLGLNSIRGLPLDVLRRAVIHVVYVYKRKGTSPGIALAVKMLTGWDAFLIEARNLIFKTWNGQSRADFGNTMASGPSTVIDLSKSYLNDEWAKATFIDSDRTRSRIFSNSLNSLQLDTGGNLPIGYVLSGTTTAVGYGFVEDTALSMISDEYKGGELIDAAGTHHRIISNDATKLYFSDPFVKAQAGGFLVYPYWEVMQGSHTLLYDDFDPRTMRGHRYDPFSQLFNPSNNVNAIELKNTDVVVTIDKVAKASGFVGSVSTVTLTDPDATWTINAFAGMKLNPNALQSQEFDIVSNTGTTITVIAPIGMDSIAQVGDRYHVLLPRDSIKLQRLRDLLPDFMAFFARPIFFFEPV